MALFAATTRLKLSINAALPQSGADARNEDDFRLAKIGAKATRRKDYSKVTTLDVQPTILNASK